MSRYAPLRKQLSAVENAGLKRILRPLEMTNPTEGILNGHPVTVFCSNDYLGLAHHPEVRAAFQGGGAGASRLISGDRPAHRELEDALSEHFGRPSTLFSSGYMANLALMSTVLQADDIVASDALNHASIIDGLRLSRAHREVVPHGEVSAVPENSRMTVVEGLYSMDGDVLDLRSYAAHPSWLAIDEAHAVGVIGPEGKGVAAAQNVEPDFLVGTLGKAYGVFGAFIVGPPELRALLISRGRSFIFTTGLPEPVAAAALVGLRLANDARRQKLVENTQRMRNGLEQLGVHTGGQHQIIPIMLGGRAMAVADALLARGQWVAGIRPPTVPVGTDRLRLTLSAAHTPNQIDRFLDALEQALQEVPDAEC